MPRRKAVTAPSPTTPRTSGRKRKASSRLPVNQTTTNIQGDSQPPPQSTTPQSKRQRTTTSTNSQNPELSQAMLDTIANMISNALDARSAPASVDNHDANFCI